jgi:trehalose 6-phosphate phosphatase
MGRNVPPDVELLAAATSILHGSRPGLITDLDGTISAIAGTPEEAKISPAVRRSLRGLSSRLTLTAIVTGRAASDARRLVRIAGVVYVGNHGLEGVTGRQHWVHPGAARAQPLVEQALAQAQAALGGVPVRYESKGLTASIHYRGTPSPAATRKAILEALSTIPEARQLVIREGRQVVELRPLGDVTKGTAVTCLLKKFNLDGALWLGDDRTDLDALRALHAARAGGQARALAVAVASAEAPPELLQEADAVLPDVAAVEALLVSLAAVQ